MRGPSGSNSSVRVRTWRQIAAPCLSLTVVPITFPVGCPVQRNRRHHLYFERDHQEHGLPGIRVDSGTVSIGAGVTVTGAGTASNRQNGLEIVGGTVSINVPAAPATSFSNNTDNGIHVSGTGSLNITGVEATASTTPSTGTVVANANYNAGLEFEQDPGQTSPSVIVGLVAWRDYGWPWTRHPDPRWLQDYAAP